MRPILVTGGTGTLGRAVVARLAADVSVRVLSRRAGDAVGDLLTGHGLSTALSGVDTVVHLATTLRGRGDVRATQNLLAAAEIRHLVYVSIVGVDRIPIGCYKGKLAAEKLVSRVPHTILRTTQFHDLVHTFLRGAARLPLLPVPTFRLQPVDVRDVAGHLLDLVTGPPRGRVRDYGGPEVLPLTTLATEYLAATNRHRRLVPVPLPGKAFRAVKAGANLVPPGNPAGRTTFAEYLAERNER